MFKYAFNSVVRRRFFQPTTANEISKTFFFKNESIDARKCFNRMRFPSEKERRLVFPFKKDHLKYKRPTVLLAGILSFFGLEKLPEEPELILKIKKGILLMQRGEFDKAEVMLHMALKLAVDEKDEEGVTYIYDMLANLAFETGQHEKAEKLFVNVLQRILSKGEPQDSNKVSHISLKLAKIYQDRNEFQKAEQGFKFCLENLDKKIDGKEDIDEDTLALWGMTTDWYARYLLIIGKKEEAFNHFKKAYDMCVKLNGIENEQTVILLNDLGTVSSMMGDAETAMSYLEQARDIGVKLPEMKELAAIYINLGQLYFLREMYADSKRACEKGLMSAKRHKNETSVLEANECLKNIKQALMSKDYKLVDSKGTGFKEAKLMQ